jgi:hypothetical protein
MRHAATTALQGHRAGFVSRLVADAVDLGVVWAAVGYLTAGWKSTRRTVGKQLAGLRRGITRCG